LIEVIRSWWVAREAGASETGFPSWSLGTSAKQIRLTGWVGCWL